MSKELGSDIMNSINEEVCSVLKVETSDGKRSFIMNLRIIVTTSHMVDKLEKDSHL